MEKIKKLNPGAAKGQKARHIAVNKLINAHREEYTRYFTEAKNILTAQDEKIEIATEEAQKIKTKHETQESITEQIL